MRSALIIGILALSSAAIAGSNRCGVGSKIFGKSQGIISQLSEITTNNVSSESYSITYGTSGCKHDNNLIHKGIGKNDRLQEQLEFADVTLEELVNEMAAGRGPNLMAFAEFFVCTGDAATAFGTMTRNSYSDIVDTENASTVEIVRRVRETFRKQMTLRHRCNAV